MSSVNQLFDNISRIGNGSCNLTNRTLANQNSSAYILKNYTNSGSFNNTVNLATNQPNVFFCGSPAGGINSNNIDKNTMLKFSPLARTPEKAVYQERLFSTVPYLGKGPGNINVECNLTSNNLNSNRKTADQNSEIDHTAYIHYPLIPSLEATISNPANLIEGVAADGWIRGGIPSRILNREQ